MIETLLWISLVITVLTAIFVVAAMVRISKGFQNAVKETRDELRASREEARSAGKELREEVSVGIKSTNDTLFKTLDGLSKAQQAQLERMTKQLKEHTESNQGALDRIRTTLDFRVKELQESNEKKLNEMRNTVDEKLHDTLEKRLGESFKLVSDRLEAVDFGIMFLATEGLYAEVLRQAALADDLQQRYRVVLAGPTTLVAILSSLRIG